MFSKSWVLQCGVVELRTFEEHGVAEGDLRERDQKSSSPCRGKRTRGVLLESRLVQCGVVELRTSIEEHAEADPESAASLFHTFLTFQDPCSSGQGSTMRADISTGTPTFLASSTELFSPPLASPPSPVLPAAALLLLQAFAPQTPDVS